MGKIRKIKKYFDARGKSTRNVYCDKALDIIEDLKENMIHYRGIGIAAPQIGYRWRIFIAVDTVMIDPIIVEKSEETAISREGCLSCPKVTRLIDRSKEITVEYTDEEGKRKIEKFEGLKAFVIQHEYDHLEGKLIIDY